MRFLTKVKRFISTLWTGGGTALPALKQSRCLIVNHSGVSDWRQRKHHIGFTEQDGAIEPVYIAAIALCTHISTIGRTGVGKTKFMILLALDYIRWGWGMLVCDPKGSAVDEILANVVAHVRKTRCDAMLRRIILIELTPDNVPSISALKWNGDAAEKILHTDNALRSFFSKRADVILNILFRVMGDKEEGSPRIKRLLRAVFQAVGIAGLDLVASLTLLDPFARHHKEVWEACKATGKLPDEVVSDLEMIHALKRPQDVFAQIEGPINRLRSLLSPLVKAAFSESVDAIDFGDAIRQRKVILVNARETAFLSRDQTLSLVSIVLHSVIEARFSESDAALAKQPPFPILVDEAADVFGPDCERVLRKGRSLRQPLGLFTQNFGAYRHENEDYTETVANECGITACFQSKTPTPEILNTLLHGRIDFTKASRVVDRPDGFDFVALPSFSRSRGSSTALSSTTGVTASAMRTVTVAESDSQEIGNALGIENRHDRRESFDVSRSASSEHSQRRSRGQSTESSREYSTSESTEQREGESTGEDVTAGTSKGFRTSNSSQSGSAERRTSSDRVINESGYRRNTDGTADGYANSSEQESRDHSLELSRSSSFEQGTSSETFESKTRRTQRSRETAHRQGHTTSTRKGRSRSESNESGIASRDETGFRLSQSSGNAEAISEEQSIRQGRGKSRAVAHQTGGSCSQSHGITIGANEGESEGYSISPLARHRTEIEILPQLDEGLDVQRERIAAELSTLGNAEMLFRDDTNCRTIRVTVREVRSPFATDDEYFAAIEQARVRLREIHAFMRTPELSPQADERRLQSQLAKLAQQRPSPLPQLTDSASIDGELDGKGAPFH